MKKALLALMLLATACADQSARIENLKKKYPLPHYRVEPGYDVTTYGGRGQTYSSSYDFVVYLDSPAQRWGVDYMDFSNTHIFNIKKLPY
jgi:hypothetical protein